MKYALEVIRLRRSFVFKPPATHLLWQRRLPANYCGDALEAPHWMSATTKGQQPGKTRDTHTYQQQTQIRV